MSSPKVTPPLDSPEASLSTVPRLAKRPGFVRTDSSVRFSPTAMVVSEPLPAARPSPLKPVLRRPGIDRLLSEAANFGLASPATPTQLNDINPFEVALAPPRRQSKILGQATRYKPLWLLGLGVTGNVLYGCGALALERGIFPRRPVAPPDGESDTLPPKFQPLFGDRVASMGVGGAAIGVGVVLAVTASTLFFADSRRLARRQNSANPNYLRGNIYYGVHLSAIALSVGGKFLSEALRDVVDRDTTWVAGLPSVLGQAAFAVTQAQAFSSCEVLNRKMPLKHRSAIGFGSRVLSGTWTVLGVMNTVPYFNPYAREITRLFCISAMTLAFSLPLTTARINREARIDPQAPHPGPSWYTLKVLGVYLIGRSLLGFAPDLLQRPQTVDETGTPTPGIQTGGAVMLSVGIAICTAMIMLYREDVSAYNPRKAAWLAGVGITAVLLIMTYRGIFETALDTDNIGLRWLSTLPGALGAGLRLAVLSEMFAYSELRRGDLPLPKRYHWTEACRATGIVGYGLWASMLSVPDFDPYIREAVGIAAALLATLGMALPTTTSRRALPKFDWPLSPGATPDAETEGFTLSPRLPGAQPA